MTVGSSEIRRLDPFLLLDNFATKLPGGFPDHPHRGFETVTYMLKGTFYHEDFRGNKGTISAGDCQWMTAGKGIVHSEMPASWDEESVGFQLWINLANKDKFCEPEYQEIKKEKIPMVTKDNVSVKVIAGESLGVTGPIFARTPALYLDIEMEANAVLEQIIPKGWNSIGYVYEGEAFFGAEQRKVGIFSTVQLRNEENEILLIKTGSTGAKIILIAGKPMNEPVVSHGPFVLGSQEDLQKTFHDYQFGRNGFENAPGWKSEIGNLRGYRNRNQNFDL